MNEQELLDKIAFNVIQGRFRAEDEGIDEGLEGQPGVQDLIRGILEAQKPLGAMCIAPVIIAVACSGTDTKPLLTIGNDAATAADIVHFGGIHEEQPVDQITIDETNKIVTTPAYMLGPGISDIAKGIEKLVKQVVSWA